MKLLKAIITEMATGLELYRIVTLQMHATNEDMFMTSFS